MDRFVYFVVVGQNGVPQIWSRAANVEALVRATSWTVAERCDTREEAEANIISQNFGLKR